MSLIKDIVLWKYERASWQWDVLCILILVFIFFTPKIWFDKREKLATQTSRLIVKAEGFSLEKSEMERRVKEISGNENAEILDIREKRIPNGETFYEIDIRK
ncbi:MAG: hypothetical protein JWN60_1188 [Acidobacteria bacterium]|jgi:hypothetical protein|nr:hypothetical protein [Acidobacteriota bacterium]